MIDSTPATLAATDELPTVAEYRPLSKLAVVALLLGLASILALVNPVLWIVPLAAIVLAIAALRAIAASPQALSGKGLALAGFSLSMLFLGWGLAQHFHHQAHVSQTAREFADDWLKVLATGDRPRAFQLHVAREYRQDPHSIKPRLTMDKNEPDQELNDFFSDPAVKEFLAAGPAVRFRFEGVTLQTRDGLSDQVVLKYTFDDSRGPHPLWITVRRTFSNAYRHADWELYSARHLPPGQ